MKIGILGCGYVGQAAASHWLAKGHDVAVTTRQPEKIDSLKSLTSKVFLLKADSLHHFLSQQDALLISVAPHAGDSYESTYLQTVQTVVSSLSKTPKLRYLLYTSSTSVYGDQIGNWVIESTPLTPINAHAKVLIDTEQLLLQHQSEKQSICILRLGEIYGPGREISQRLRRQQGQSFPGIGDQYANLIHRDDIVKALDFALQNQLSGIYNLCQDAHPSRRELYALLCEQEGLPPVKWDPQLESRHGGNKRISSEKLKALGFACTHLSVS